MSWLSNFLNPKNPADAANPYFNQIPGAARGELGEYAQAGKDALGRLGGEYDKLLSDPTAFINALMSGYQQSDAYKARRDEELGQASNTAAAGGFGGTETDIKNQAGIVDKLLAGDQQQFLQNVLGAYGMGMQGEQGIMGQGFGASQDLANTLANVLGTQGSLAFQGQAQKNANNAALMKALGSLGGSFLGGPAGMGFNTMPNQGGMFF